MRLPVGVGLIGYGFSGRTFHAPLIRSIDGLELRGIASRQAGRVETDMPSVPVHVDPASLIANDDINLIVIATPNDTHAPLARAAIATGKHVVIDKPFALDMAEARALIALAEQRGVMLSVFHNRRWDSDFLTIRRAIEDGSVGKVSHFESHFDRFRPEVRDRWREQGGAGSGVWFDLGPHLVDQALQLFGLPDYVQADLAPLRDGATSDDWAHVVLIYAAQRIILHAGMLVAGGTHRFAVHGNVGSMVKHAGDPQEAQLIAGMRPGAPGWGFDTDPLILFDASGEERRIAAMPGDQRCYYAGMRAALAGTAPNPIPPIEALAIMAVVAAGVESSRTRSAVCLTLTDRERQAWHDGR